MRKPRAAQGSSGVSAAPVSVLRASRFAQRPARAVLPPSYTGERHRPIASLRLARIARACSRNALATRCALDTRSHTRSFVCGGHVRPSLGTARNGADLSWLAPERALHARAHRLHHARLSAVASGITYVVAPPFVKKGTPLPHSGTQRPRWGFTLRQRAKRFCRSLYRSRESLTGSH
jgi:hypothetical protein